jgi:hypothetical protein
MLGRKSSNVSMTEPSTHCRSSTRGKVLLAPLAWNSSWTDWPSTSPVRAAPPGATTSTCEPTSAVEVT